MRFLVIAAALLLAGCAGQAGGPAPDAAARFRAAAASPATLRAFLQAMPKGGDLHTHLSGAAYAEALIRAGAANPAHPCVDPTRARRAACGEGTRPIADALTDPALNHRLVDAWSMRDFVPVSGESRHNHFFATFGLLSGVASRADMAADVVDRAGQQHMRYIELMVTFQGPPVSALAAGIPWSGNLDAARRDLMDAGLPALVSAGRAEVAALEHGLRQRLGCDTPQARPGCGVTVRWLQQVSRTGTPPAVFAQTLFGALLAKAEPHVVGLDYVAPEDDPRALAAYSTQMHMLDDVGHALPQTNISLHAGELTLGLVPPEELRFHIREAVEIGHARRIGHGVDISYEDGAAALLRRMAADRVAVEVNLTSNEMTLGVSGAAHPFLLYREAGVPVVISTDDEGVERTDRTHEIELAVERYGLSWADVVELERNTLEYAFVAGASLWADGGFGGFVPACAGADPAAAPPAACAAWLDGSEKAQLQWALEHDLATFDRAGEAR